MQLDPTEEQLIQACRKEEHRWKRWSLAFSVTGYALIGIWLLARRAPVMGESAIIVLAAAFYLIEAGINERREHSLRKLVLRFAEQK
jgi:hypothetical protein